VPGTKDDDFQAAFQKQSLFIFPVMIGFFSFTLPVGLSLYWNTFTLFGILQQYLLVGPGGAAPWFKKLNLYGREK
jgi:YidC/Oxa1 family membrane protein insertase